MAEWTEMRPVGLEFLEAAELRVAVEVVCALPRRTVWDAFVDPSTWVDWFPGVEEAAYPEHQPPYGPGTKRTARVRVSGFSSGTMARTEASCGLPSSRVRTTVAPGVSPTMRW